MADLRLPFSIKPATESEASHYARYGVGGYYSVDSPVELEKIPEARLETGLIVYIKSNGKTYRYTGTGWVEVVVLTREVYDLTNEWIEED